MLLASAGLNCSHTDINKDKVHLFGMYDMNCFKEEVEVVRVDSEYYAALCEARNQTRLYKMMQND